LGIVAIQAVQARARMGVQHGQRRVFLIEVVLNGDQAGVFEHIGMIACMKGMAVTEHALMVTTAPWLAWASVNSAVNKPITYTMRGFAANSWLRGETYFPT
jgi:hypothetical protein